MKAALVTGASSGIGQAVARALAAGRLRRRAGRPQRRPARAARRRARTGLAVPTDVSRRDEVQALVEQTVERFGRLDAVVTAAGVFHSRPGRAARRGDLRRDDGGQRQGHLPRRAGRAAPPPRQQGLPDHRLLGLGDDGPAGRRRLQHLEVGRPRLHAVVPAGGARRRRARDGDLARAASPPRCSATTSRTPTCSLRRTSPTPCAGCSRCGRSCRSRT